MEKNIVSLLSFSQHVMRSPNAPGIHEALYGAWWGEAPDGVQK